MICQVDVFEIKRAWRLLLEANGKDKSGNVPMNSINPYTCLPDVRLIINLRNAMALLFSLVGGSASGRNDAKRHGTLIASAYFERKIIRGGTWKVPNKKTCN